MNECTNEWTRGSRKEDMKERSTSKTPGGKEDGTERKDVPIIVPPFKRYKSEDDARIQTETTLDDLRYHKLSNTTTSGFVIAVVHAATW